MLCSLMASALFFEKNFGSPENLKPEMIALSKCFDLNSDLSYFKFHFII